MMNDNTVFIEYKGFVISYRKKPWMVTSAYDYDWHYITAEKIPFWKYAPSIEAAKTDIDLFLISSVFDTTGI